MNQPSWLKDAIFYQIYPQTFADSNGDGIGDLPGLIAKLDYIRSLGVSALWLCPLFDSPFGDAGYDVSDFRKVAPRYGTNDDLVRLFREAHARGLRVVLDLVAGHTSVDHPWFREACKAERNRFSPYYIFTGDEEQRSGVDGRPTPVPGSRGGFYASNFFGFQPALNFGYAHPDPAKPWQLPPDHPDCLAVREELRDIMRFWLDRGCDGFRVDMASSLIKNDPDAIELRRLWQGFRAWLDRDYPEAILVSEWSRPSVAIEAGFHIDFLIHFNETAYLTLVGPGYRVEGKGRRPHVFFERAGEGDIHAFLEPYQRHVEATRGKGYISLPTCNHDFQRPSRGRDEAELRVLYTMLFTMPGVPFLYYGDEIGMRNLDALPDKEGSMWRSGNRTPMQWTANKPNLGFSTAAAERLYLPTDPAPDAPTVSEQETRPDSLLQFTRGLLALRRAHSPLGNDGAFRPLFEKCRYAFPLFGNAPSYPFVYERSDETGRFAVALNPGETARSINLPNLTGATRVWGDGVRIEGSTLHADGVSAAVFRLAARAMR